jgi:hypothetical protein
VAGSRRAAAQARHEEYNAIARCGHQAMWAARKAEQTMA